MHYLVDPPVHIYNTYVFAVSKHGLIFSHWSAGGAFSAEIKRFLGNDKETGSARLFVRV